MICSHLQIAVLVNNTLAKTKNAVSYSAMIETKPFVQKKTERINHLICKRYSLSTVYI